jgi:hypothetical protein
MTSKYVCINKMSPSQLKMKLFVLIACIVLFSCHASALQASYMYVSLSYGRGWFPWICVTEMGWKGVFDPDLFCDGGLGIRLCPFEDGIMPGTVSCSYYEEGENRWLPPAWGLVVKITIPEDFKYVDSAGYVLGDEICRGDSVRLAKGALKGEYWQDGGNEDSPPIYWVDDAESVFQDLMNYHESYQTSFKKDILGSGGKPVDGFLDPMLKIPVYTMPVRLDEMRIYLDAVDEQGTEPETYLTGSLICSLKKKAGVDELVNGGVKIKETEDREYLTFSSVYGVECWYFYYGGSGGYSAYTGYWSDIADPLSLNDYLVFRVPTVIQYDGSTNNLIDYQSKEDFFKVGEIGINKTIKVVDPAKPMLEVSVAGGDVINFGVSNTLRVLVKNTGDVDVSIKSVNSRPVGKLVSCDVVVLKPGQSGECLLSVTPMLGDGVSVQVSYDYKSCGKNQVGLETKVLIASKVLEPVLSEQSYLMGVHGGCENSYYACNEAKTQPSLFAGYKCYKTSNGFYTPTTERFNLKFDLSSLPKGLVISGARLNIYSNSVGKVQSVGVYSVDRDWKALQCVPGGDICARPYCSECAPVYDLGGVLQSSQSVKSADRYSFDVSALIKDKYSKGDSSVSLQVRGVEGLWESMGQSGCSVENNWEKLDVSFDSASGNAPYLEIIYKE